MESIDTKQNFIPQPIYPLGIDTDYTLFQVKNTTESTLSQDNQAWSEVIYINPYDNPYLNDDPWPENGFATLDGELLYYGSVEKDYSTAKVIALKGCIRNLNTGRIPAEIVNKMGFTTIDAITGDQIVGSGKATHYNLAGTPIRGFVIAEHHNQLVKAIINIENFVGIDFDENQKTLDWKIRNLFNTPPIFDDYGCPDVNFTIITLNKDPNSGTLISFNLSITGDYKNFRINFGDGTSTTNQLNGTHLYPISASIDPVVNVETNNCNIVQTPINRDKFEEPSIPVGPEPIFIQIPECPALPPLDINIPSIPQPVINIPPIIFPVFDIGMPNINIPSVITVDPPIPSLINFGPIDPIPSLIEFGPISIPSMILIVPTEAIPSIIKVDSNIPSFIKISDIKILPPPPIPPISIIISLIIPSIIPNDFLPSEIKVIVPSVCVSFCKIKFPCISFCKIPSFPCISFCKIPSFNCISFCKPPSFPCISFCKPPSFPCISFCKPPSFPCVSFCKPPSFACISFCKAPSFPCISFCKPPSLPCISFCKPPSFACISFCKPPSFPCISFCKPPSLPCISFCKPPSFGCISFCKPPSFPCISFCRTPSFPCISFCKPPTLPEISFSKPPSFTCISFCKPPSFPCISFCKPPSLPEISFGKLPSFPCVSFCKIPSLAPISFIIPSFGCISFCKPPLFPCISFCKPPSFPTVISIGEAPSFAPIIFAKTPSFPCISFCDAPSFTKISFDKPPSITVYWTPQVISIHPTSIEPISFVKPPSFACISFCNVPSMPDIRIIVPSDLPCISICAKLPCISFCTPPNLIVSFGTPPSIQKILFDKTPSFEPIPFGKTPSIKVEFGTPPSLDCIKFCAPPSFQKIGFENIPSFEPIPFGKAPSLIVKFDNPPNISLDYGKPPRISVDWGTPPVVSCVVRVVCPSNAVSAALNSGKTNISPSDGGKGYYDELGMQMEYDFVGIPDEIKLIVPEINDITVLHDIPEFISLVLPEISSIKIEFSEPIPSEIRLNHNIPENININSESIPEFIKIDAGSIPSLIKLQSDIEIPNNIKIEFDSFPSSISVTGIPDHIELIGTIPSEIKLKMPENPEIEMVYKGSPIEVKVELDYKKLLGDQNAEDFPCFAIIPCPPRK